MDRLFRSRIGGWYYLLMFLMTFVCVRAFMEEQTILTVCSVLLLFLLLHIYFSTYYIVTRRGGIVMRCSLFRRRLIEIADISKIEYTTSSSFAYALSMNRIILRKKDNTKELVSPEKSEMFISLLLRFNPEIEIIPFKNKSE